MPTAPQGLVALVTDAIAYVASLQTGQSGPITVAIADEEGHAVTVVIGASGLVSATEPRAVAGLLNDTDHAILETVRNSQAPLRGKEIAAQLGKRYSSHFREALSRLCQQHILLRTTTGYILADPRS
jgi:hypothetical protein